MYRHFRILFSISTILGNSRLHPRKGENPHHLNSEFDTRHKEGRLRVAASCQIFWVYLLAKRPKHPPPHKTPPYTSATVTLLYPQISLSLPIHLLRGLLTSVIHSFRVHIQFHHPLI